MWPYELDEEEDHELVDDINHVKEYEIDFKTGQLTGKVVEGSKAIAMWAWMAIQTDVKKFLPYSWDYGSELRTLIGTTHSIEYLESEISRMITECLLKNEYISGIDRLKVTREKDKIHISFMIESTMGEEELEIDV